MADLDKIDLKDPATPKRMLSVSSTDDTPVTKVRVTDCDSEKNEIIAAIKALENSVKSDLASMEKEIRRVKEQVPKEVEKKMKAVTEGLTIEMAHLASKVESIEISVRDLSNDFASKLALIENRVSALEFHTAKPAPREAYNLEDTLVVTGLPYSPDENVQEKAKDLVQVHLGLKECTVVRAKRTPWRNNRPGIVKVQMGHLDEKIKVLKAKTKLKEAHSPAFLRKVYIRSSKSHEQRLMELNLREIMGHMSCNGEYRFTGSGRLVKKKEEGHNELQENQDEEHVP